jgi:hypothetical protein
MKIIHTLGIAAALSIFTLVPSAPAQAAGEYKCKGGTSFGQMSFKFKKRSCARRVVCIAAQG